MEKVIYKKLDFFRNAGSQDYLLKNNECNKTLIHIHNKNLGRIWGLINESQILPLIEKNIGLFEVIHKFPFKVYFDIDGEEDIKVDLDKVKSIINKYFNNPKMSISGYKKDKHSYHIVLPEYIIKTEEERQTLKHLVKYINKNEYQYFDWKVYTKNRNMKAINQSKIKKPVQEVIENENKEDHLITFYIKETLPLPKFEILVPEIETEKIIDNSKIIINELPKLELTLPNDIDLNNALEVLSIIPNNKDFNHSWSWRVALFCASNDISLDNFISWYKNKSTDINQINKWINIHWKRVLEEVKTYQITIKSMLKLLQVYYPNILEKKEMLNLVNNFDISKNNIKKTDYLTLNDFETDRKALIVNIGMGGGKTENTINYLKNKNFCWITPNISLALNTFYRIESAGIDCHLYDNARNKKEKAFRIADENNLIICLNSLKYITKTYDVIVIDEIETFLKLWFNNKTLDGVLNTCWEIFINLLKSSKKIILLDAFISKLTLNFLDSSEIDYQIIQKTKEVSTRKAVILSGFEKTFLKIKRDLLNGKKLIIFYPYKVLNKNYPSMESFTKTLASLTNKKGIFHNADQSEKINSKLKNVNENWIQYDFVVSNNKINVGLNFDVEYFDKVYLFIAGFNSPRDIIQFSYRARTVKDNIINYCYLDTFNNIIATETIHVEKYDEVYQNLNEDVFIERTSPLVDTFNFFLHKALYEINNECINELLEDNKLEFEEQDHYEYNKLRNIEGFVEKLEKQLYKKELNLEGKLLLKKHYFEKRFKSETDSNIKADIWNNNKITFMKNVINTIEKNDLVKKLKDNYKWTLLLPDDVDSSFKFNKDDLEGIFNTTKFKKLTTKSKHHLILKSYINTIYECEFIQSKHDKNKHYQFKVSDTYKNYYINIVENVNFQQSIPTESDLFTD